MLTMLKLLSDCRRYDIDVSCVLVWHKDTYHDWNCIWILTCVFHKVRSRSSRWIQAKFIDFGACQESSARPVHKNEYHAWTRRNRWRSDSNNEGKALTCFCWKIWCKESLVLWCYLAIAVGSSSHWCGRRYLWPIPPTNRAPPFRCGVCKAGKVWSF